MVVSDRKAYAIQVTFKAYIAELHTYPLSGKRFYLRVTRDSSKR